MQSRRPCLLSLEMFETDVQPIMDEYQLRSNPNPNPDPDPDPNLNPNPNPYPNPNPSHLTLTPTLTLTLTLPLTRYWKRYQSVLAFKWDCTDFEEEELLTYLLPITDY